MRTSPWQLSTEEATLGIPQGTAVLNISRPEDGLHRIGSLPDDWALLKIRSAGLDWPAGASPPEAHVRDRDLVVTHGRMGDLPFALQTDWRANYLMWSDSTWGLELIVSTQTVRLDSHACISTESLIGGTELLHLRDGGQGNFETLYCNKEPITLTPADGTGCIVFRTPNASYIEMIHPDDFSTLCIARRTDLQLWSIAHTAIDRWLEKGVIVRARLRGLLAPRSKDLAIAQQVYRDFCRGPVPLTT